MAEIDREIVTIFELRFRGESKTIGLSIEELRREFPGRFRTKVVSYQETVGVIRGEVNDWNKGGGYANYLKLHWTCPQCGQHQWGDLEPGEPNPCLWYSNCRCTDKWLIHYQSPRVSEWRSGPLRKRARAAHTSPKRKRG